MESGVDGVGRDGLYAQERQMRRVSSQQPVRRLSRGPSSSLLPSVCIYRTPSQVQAQRTASKASTKADSDDSDIEDLCSLCSPFDPAATAKEGVSRYPMAKERKKQREAEVAVCVLEWMPVDGEEDEAMTLVVKRPAKGAPPTVFSEIGVS